MDIPIIEIADNECGLFKSLIVYVDNQGWTMTAIINKHKIPLVLKWGEQTGK
jgi:hypothetical protein